MKKIIVVRLENVMVNGYDVVNVFYGKMRKMVGEKFERFVKREKVVKENGEEKRKLVWVDEEMSWREGFEGVEKMLGFVEKSLRERGESVYDLVKMRKRLEEMEDSKFERLVELRREYFEKNFEKKGLVKNGGICLKEEFDDLEKMRDFVKDLRVIVVSENGKRKVENLLKRNGLGWVEVIGSNCNVCEVVEGFEKDKLIVFSKEEREIEELRNRGICCEDNMKGGLLEKIGVKRMKKVEEKKNDVEVESENGNVEVCEEGNGNNGLKRDENMVIGMFDKGIDCSGNMENNPDCVDGRLREIDSYDNAGNDDDPGMSEDREDDGYNGNRVEENCVDENEDKASDTHIIFLNPRYFFSPDNNPTAA